MSFRRKITAVLLVVGVAPVALLGLFSYQANRDELTAAVGRMEARAAEELAREAERHVVHAIEGLQLSASTLPLAALSSDELKDVLHIPYRQVGGLNALVLLDGEGNALVAPVYEVLESGEAPVGRETVGAPELARFATRVPLAEALSLGAAVGPPYQGHSGTPRVAIAVRASENPSRVVAAELSLQALQRRLAEVGTAGDLAFLVDASGTPIAQGGTGEQPSTEALKEAVLVGSAHSRSARWGQTEYLVAFAPVPGLGWGVVVAKPAKLALSAADRVRLYTFFWMAAALLLTVALGAFLARDLSRPIAELSQAAKALTEGSYDREVAVRGHDELGAFAEAFNHMARELKRRDAEIRGWNDELKQRVERATAELKEAQDQILRTRRLAALGSLGAGIAHELNNPMTAVMGLVGLLRKDLSETEHFETLGLVLEQSQRMTAIIQQLRSFTDAERASAGRRFPLSSAVLAAIGPFEGRLKERSIELSAELGAVLPEVQGEPGELQQVICHLVENAMHAMPRGGRLSISLSAVDGEAVRLSVRDTGRGIPRNIQERIFDPFFSTKHDPTGVGLGLSISHRIIEKHHGKILVDSEEGVGTTFTVLLPAAGQAAHLN